MSGNERTVSGFAIANAIIKSGYKVTPQDSFVLQTSLMNMEDVEKWAWITITYEVLDGLRPDYRPGKQVFMTIGAPAATCGRAIRSPWGPSNLTVALQPKTAEFIEHSIPWIAPQDGYILSTGGHMHDGGTTTEIFKNEKRICDSVTHYSESKGAMVKRQQPGDQAATDTAAAHIERQDICSYPEGIPLKKGDSMHLLVKYDFKAHPGYTPSLYMIRSINC
jgi:hypothetical protein